MLPPAPYTPATWPTVSGRRLPAVSTPLLFYRSFRRAARDRRASAPWPHSGLGRTAQAPVQQHARIAQQLLRGVPVLSGTDLKQRRRIQFDNAKTSFWDSMFGILGLYSEYSLSLQENSNHNFLIKLNFLECYTASQTGRIGPSGQPLSELHISHSFSCL